MTHRLHVLPYADHVVLMQQGRIVAQGSYEELLVSCPEFIKMMQSLQNNDEDNGQDVTKKPKKKVVRERSEVKKRDATGAQAKLISSEERATGQIGFGVYRSYFHLNGGWIFGSVVLFLLVVSQVSRIANDFWLNVWVELKIPGWQTNDRYEEIYASLGVIQSIFMVVAGIVFCVGGVIASGRIHDMALLNVFKVSP